MVAITSRIRMRPSSPPRTCHEQWRRPFGRRHGDTGVQQLLAVDMLGARVLFMRNGGEPAALCGVGESKLRPPVSIEAEIGSARPLRSFRTSCSVELCAFSIAMT